MKQPLRTQSRERVAGQRRGLGILRLLIVCVFVSYIIGCASTGLPTLKERTAVGASEKAIVLLRVDCVVENQQPYEAFKHSVMDDNISFGLGSFETGGEPKRLALLRFLSPESRKEGWTYFVLPHGIHYLAVYPPRRTDVLTYERGLKNAPRWRLDIPLNARLIYAGTLRFTGESIPLLFGGRIMTSIRIDEMRVTNDEEWARKLLTEEFPGFGEVQSVLLRLQQGPTILRSPLPSPTE
ncbi:MAG: hypothetical protein A2512_07295 [Deltaproteobacteria bacterium RIFOXYD12_FULL_56_24]|nr:MAG: hypothetical protein A2512_07295 [Deltaproteobacteria bacterium RIFOXYD12_FULL_56_24]